MLALDAVRSGEKEMEMPARRRPIVVRNRYLVISDLLLTALSATLGFAIRLEIPLFWTYLPICIPFVLFSPCPRRTR